LSKIVDGAKVILNEQVKAEMHQSEVGTNNLYECQRSRKRTKISAKIVELADKQG
jgi:carboxylate-amine ligase